jgi:hypothetical protein
MRTFFLIGLAVLVNACDQGTESTAPIGASSSEVQLRSLLPADAVPVGVTVAPDGKRYVLDQRSGLYEVGDERATLVFNTTGLSGVELTDVVALDADRFAVTAENDGFLLNLRSNELTSYFCYLPSVPPPVDEPGGVAGGPSQPPINTPLSISQTLQLQGVAVKQRTESVALNPDTRQLFAQPRTIRLDTGGVAGSELFVFAEGGGEPIQVLPFAQTDFVAGGMVAATGNRLLLGAGSALFEATLSGEVRLIRQLDAATNITGMARAPDGSLWLLDGSALRLLKLDNELERL